MTERIVKSRELEPTCVSAAILFIPSAHNSHGRKAPNQHQMKLLGTFLSLGHEERQAQRQTRRRTTGQPNCQPASTSREHLDNTSARASQGQFTYLKLLDSQNGRTYPHTALPRHASEPADERSAVEREGAYSSPTTRCSSIRGSQARRSMQLRTLQAFSKLHGSTSLLTSVIKLTANSQLPLVGPLPLLHAHPFRSRSLIRCRLLISAFQEARVACVAWDGLRCWAGVGRV